LNKRLNAISELVEDGTQILADIGSDHAYLVIQLLKDYRISRAIVTDINEKPLERAMYNATRYNVSHFCDFRRCAGLEGFIAGEADVITISGMGAETIISILKDNPQSAKSAKYLILQPNSGAESLRKFLDENGYGNPENYFVQDRHLFYQILRCSQPFDKTIENHTLLREEDYQYPIMEAILKDPGYFEFLTHELSVQMAIADTITKKSEPNSKKNTESLEHLKDKIKRINERLSKYDC
jgi:tRNA (adenine22-N1)-methyltransferase